MNGCRSWRKSLPPRLVLLLPQPHNHQAPRCVGRIVPLYLAKIRPALVRGDAPPLPQLGPRQDNHHAIMGIIHRREDQEGLGIRMVSAHHHLQVGLGTAGLGVVMVVAVLTVLTVTAGLAVLERLPSKHFSSRIHPLTYLVHSFPFVSPPSLPPSPYRTTPYYGNTVPFGSTSYPNSPSSPGPSNFSSSPYFAPYSAPKPQVLKKKSSRVSGTYSR